MESLKRIADRIDAINNWVGGVVNWVVVLLVAVVFGDVLMRYLFNWSWVFVQELEWHIFAFIFLLGAGYTLITDNHVRVDIFYQRFNAKQKAWLNLVCCLLCLFPGCILVISTSLSFVMTSYAQMEGSPDPGGIPLRFILKACIPAGYVLFLLQGVSLFIRSLLTIRGFAADSEEKKGAY
jgi:TRAP-type mannitol/chloroaromatic compound transport system permease small subunit